MRWLLCGLAIIGMAPQARAADMPWLRGSNTIVATQCCTTWDGFYFGAQAGATVSGADFSSATRSLLQFMLRETTIENEQPVSARAVAATFARVGFKTGTEYLSNLRYRYVASSRVRWLLPLYNAIDGAVFAPAFMAPFRSFVLTFGEKP
jgi:hypothetical protein